MQFELELLKRINSYIIVTFNFDILLFIIQKQIFIFIILMFKKEEQTKIQNLLGSKDLGFMYLEF